MKKLLNLNQTGDWVKDVIRIELKGIKAQRYEKEQGIITHKKRIGKPDIQTKPNLKTAFDAQIIREIPEC